MGTKVTLVEVGPRDGLQNEPQIIPASQKIKLIDLLSRSGLTRIEVASFVSARRVPQMADGAEVLAGIARLPGVRFAALVPNLQGYAQARDAKADEVAVFASASEGFSRHNTNCTMAESLVRLAAVASAAADDGIPVRGYVSCVIACPYDGPTPPTAVAAMSSALLEMGCYEVSLGDTTGVGTPGTVSRLLDEVLTAIPASKLAGHFHDTGGRALSNIEVGLERGLRTFDTSVAGLGGCPFAPGAPGNVATRSVAYHLSRRGIETGLDLDRLAEATIFARALKGGPSP